MPNKLDRNANSFSRLRRNMQRMSQGAIVSTLPVKVNAIAPLTGGGPISTSPSLGINQATSTVNGYLSSTDWTTFNNKQAAGSFLSTATQLATTAPVAGGGYLSTGLTVSMSQVTSTVNGWLSSTDWTTFNGKQAAGNYVSTGRLINTSAPLTGGGDLTADRTLSMPQASSTANGYLSSTDWNTFHNGGSGTVTSVGQTVPAFLTILGSPITTAGTLAIDLATQASTTVFAGPSTGAVAKPTFRNLVAGDIPALAYVAGGQTIATTAPLTGGGTLSTGLTIAIPQATSTASGYLSSTDWTTFNNPTYGWKNRLINGNFDFWQRGTTLTNSIGYLADRWTLATAGNASTAVTSQYVMALAELGSAKYALKWNQNSVSSSSNPTVEQRIEGVTTLQGQSTAISVWLKADAAVTLSTSLTQNFGTGGSPSASVVTQLGTAAVTSTWQKFTFLHITPSVSGKTLGTGGNDYLAFQIYGPLNATYVVYIAQAQVEPGNAVSDFEWRPPAFELNLCQRYYHKSYTSNVTPGTVTDTGMVAFFTSGSAGETAPYVLYPAEMRALPTVLFYSTHTGSTGVIFNASATVDETCGGPNGFGFQSHTGASGARSTSMVYRYQFTAITEL